MPFNRHKRKNIEGIQLHKYLYKCWHCGCDLGSGSKPKENLLCSYCFEYFNQ